MLVNTKKQIIRNIEICSNNNYKSDFYFEAMLDDALVIGIHIDRELLRNKIKERLIQRIESGMIDEVKKLLRDGLSMGRLNYFGLEYKYIGKFIKKELSRDELVEELTTAIRKFAKRQRTWFRRMEKRGVCIHWIDYNDFEALNLLVNQNIHGWP